MIISKNQETKFEIFYKLFFKQVFIRDLLLLKSFYHTHLRSDVIELVNIQGNSSIFFQPLLELDRVNMVTILAYDSKLIKSLVENKFDIEHHKEYPIIFLNQREISVMKDDKKETQYQLYSAIDQAKNFN